MKRYLKKDNFQLSGHEKENLWLKISDAADPVQKPTPSRRFLKPVLGVSTILAAVLALVIFMSDEAPVVPYVANHQPEPTKEETTTVAGRILDRESGDPLINANIIIEGTDKSLVTDYDGRFILKTNPADTELTLRVKYLGYDDEVATITPEAGNKSKVVISMDPTIVVALEAFDVEGDAYMVDVSNASTEHIIYSETFEKFAISSVEDALSKQAGVVKRAGELHMRGGRSGEVDFQIDGFVTGGTTAPNGEPHELMYFEHSGFNPFVATEEDSLSTFAVDVDNASYTMARRYIDGGSLPPAEAIRVEEFINFFEAGYERQTEDTFAINCDGAPSRFGDGYQMVRVGLQGKTVLDENRKAANLVFLIDISGSMDQGNRLGLVKQSLRILLDELAEGDRVAIVVYGSRAEVRLEPTDINHREVILTAIESLRPSGATNAYAGLQEAYRIARENYKSHKLNRLILCSDGVANMGGSTKAEDMLEQIRKASDKGITLSTIGFGMGNYNDELMEKLADQGDGNYYYVDQPKEAQRVFSENLTGLLQTIARQVKVQVVFDTSKIQRWRLLGYENRDVADNDFRNDDVDAGEVGSGHQVTALYELKMVDDVSEGSLGTVHLRYEMPAHHSELEGQVMEISRPLQMEQLVPAFHLAPARYRLQVVVTEFAEILRGSFWAKERNLADLIPLADGLSEELAGDERVKELAALIRKAADLQSE